MAWIELHDNLPDHPKVLDLSEELKLDKDTVVGKLVRWWVWTLANRENGVFVQRDLALIAEVMRFKGKPERLVNALLKARLLDRQGDDYAVHDWEKRVGMLLAKREAMRTQTRERVKKYRATRGAEVTDEEDDCNALHDRYSNAECNALHDRYGNAECNACNAATVPKPYPTVPIDEDDEEDEETRNRNLCAREVGIDKLFLAQQDAENAVKLAFQAHFSRKATSAEAAQIARSAIIRGKSALIGEAIHRAAVHGAQSVTAYTNQIFKEWRNEEVDTQEDLDEYEALNDCAMGRSRLSMSREEAFTELDKRRQRKRQMREGRG